MQINIIIWERKHTYWKNILTFWPILRYAVVRRRIKIRSNNVNDELFLRYKPNLREKKEHRREKRRISKVMSHEKKTGSWEKTVVHRF